MSTKKRISRVEPGPSDEFSWIDMDALVPDVDLVEEESYSGPFEAAQTYGGFDLPEEAVFTETDPIVDDDVGAPQDDFDLSEMLSPEEGSYFDDGKTAASLANLDWLDPTREQDPERLPESRDSGFFSDEPSGSIHVVPELEEAWGVHDRTDGLRRVPNVTDREIARYEQSIEGGLPATPGVEKSASDVAWHLRKAQRMSTYGHPLGEITTELRRGLGERLAVKAASLMAGDHGLAGNVFVRASAFPGLKNGKWVAHLKKTARGARYVVTDDAVVAAKLGMKMVPEVPWKAAYAHYAPRLRVAGYEVRAVDGTDSIRCREALRRAFLKGPKQAVISVSEKPVDIRPADTITTVLAKEMLGASSGVRPAPVRVDETVNARKVALVYVAKAVRAGLLPHGDALRLGRSSASPADICKTADRLVQVGRNPETSIYAGVGTGFRAVEAETRDGAWAALQQAELTALSVKKARERITEMTKMGLLREKEARFALGKPTAAEMLRTAVAIVRVADVNRTSETPSVKTRSFEGAVYRRAERQETASERKHRDAAWTALQEETVLAGEVQKVRDRVAKMVSTGRITEKEAAHVSKQATVEQMTGMLAAVVQAKDARRGAVPDAGPSGEFTGPVYREATAVPSTERVKTAETERLATWLRRQMSEGMAGDTLSSLLQVRFAGPVRKAASSVVTALREEHEGLSGFLYVDADAYASRTGTAGCEKAAPTHRATQVKFVKAMKRCGSCVFANPDGICTKYGKRLLHEMPRDAGKFKASMLRLADAPDHEITASLFEPNEFDLRSGMEHVELDAESPSARETGDLLFGDGLRL